MTQWTVRQSILFLVGSTCLTLTLSVAGYLLWKKGDRTKSLDPKYQIISIIQTGPEKEALKTVYLAELLSLSSDSFASLYDFDCKEGEKKLLLSPLISSASIKKMEPDALYIDYEVRKPIAWLSDYQNIGIDLILGLVNNRTTFAILPLKRSNTILCINDVMRGEHFVRCGNASCLEDRRLCAALRHSTPFLVGLPSCDP